MLGNRRSAGVHHHRPFLPTKVPSYYVILAVLFSVVIIGFIFSPLWHTDPPDLYEQTFINNRDNNHRDRDYDEQHDNWRPTPLVLPRKRPRPSSPPIEEDAPSIVANDLSTPTDRVNEDPQIASEPSVSPSMQHTDTTKDNTYALIEAKLPVVAAPPTPPKSVMPCRVFVFTMDSLKSREEERLRGGAGGEHFVRTRLQDELINLGCEIKVADSDHAMDMAVQDAQSHGGMGQVYRWIIMDQWTAISPQLQLRSWLHGIENRLRITAFFGQVSSNATNNNEYRSTRAVHYFLSFTNAALLGWTT
jgi:hypothetical protein